MGEYSTYSVASRQLLNTNPILDTQEAGQSKHTSTHTHLHEEDSRNLCGVGPFQRLSEGSTAGPDQEEEDGETKGVVHDGRT